MKANRNNLLKQTGSMAVLFSLLFWQSTAAYCKDTDIYSVNTKQNAYVLMDSSGSMSSGVYESAIDYGAMYDYLFTLNDSPAAQGADNYDDYIYDTVNNNDNLYGHHKPGDKIYLWKGDVGVSIANVEGEDIAFSGDAGDRNNYWNPNDLIDTHTLIDSDGNLSDDGTGQRRITADSEGYILLDDIRLPLGLDIKAQNIVTLSDGTITNKGFTGLLKAPGYYFSGYEGVALNALNQVEDGDDDIYFFVTGNWVNMQAMYNLHYTEDPQGVAGSGDAAWKYETFPVPTSSWIQSGRYLNYPVASVNYTDGLTENDTAQTIVSAGAQYIQLHFSAFDVEGDSSSATFNSDYLKIYDLTGTQVIQYDNDNKPTDVDDGWSSVIPGDTAVLKLYSDNSGTGTGYTIDKIRLVYEAAAGGSYLMQSRLDVAKDAMRYIVNAFRGKMNWGFASFGDNANGASLDMILDPGLSDDEQRTDILTAIDLVTASGYTPLMEALQDIWNDGYYGISDDLDELLCRKNYIISMTDGFPSNDDDASRIDGVTFDDWDADGWTQDPLQGQGYKPDYYDDVAHWMYTHSWLDQSEVSDPANSYTNVTTHHIAFGAKHPLLEDAAGESGGEYIVAYNKEQLISAFYSLATMMSESVSFTAPVVSVDAVNKIQSGEDLYMGLFLPQDSTSWVGNLKKFKIGDGTSTDRPKRFMIYDRDNNEAIDSTGQFVDNLSGFWGDDYDPSDTDNYGAADIKEDGVGEVLLEEVQGYFSTTDYWARPIYTWKDGAMVKFDRDHITAADLSVPDDMSRDKLVNYIHGYTYDAATTTGTPLAVREWILGSIIHSRPVVVDYFDTSDSELPLIKRLVVVGSNDGMLHVFDDNNGREVLAFIPQDILPQLQHVQANALYETVDGPITLYQRDKTPKYLIFGERRGGRYFWNLDISDSDPLQWTVAWNYTNPEIAQSWSEVKVATIPVAITAAGEKSFKDVAIFTAGYDPEEDFFPEPFIDQDSNGTPYMEDGSIDSSEWLASTASQDVYDDDIYNLYNPEMNEQGRGIFVVDIDDPALVTSATLANGATSQLLPFSVTYGTVPVTSGAAQTMEEMKFSFPASPSVVTGTDQYYHKVWGEETIREVKTNVLLSLYAVDVYANLFKARFIFDIENISTGLVPDWQLNSATWKVDSVFNGNPGSTSSRAEMGGLDDSNDQGRKAFYPPSVSWGGSKGYFEAGNYYFPEVTFANKDKLASLFFGTGDRENPQYTMIRNRFYAIYDDTAVTAELHPPLEVATDVPISSAPYFEKDLLNLTCDEFGEDSIITSCYLGDLDGACDDSDETSANTDMKAYLRSLLTDDAVYGTPAALEYGQNYENDAKGWYIVLDDQGQTCDHMEYASSILADSDFEHDNHHGEQILSQPALYYGTLYFTSYQATTDDPCTPQGNGFSYAINYQDSSATYDLNDSHQGKKDITDRYKKFNAISGLPSGFSIITSGGQAAAMANMGGALIGPSPEPDSFPIDTPGLGLELFYWLDNGDR